MRVCVFVREGERGGCAGAGVGGWGGGGGGDKKRDTEKVHGLFMSYTETKCRKLMLVCMHGCECLHSLFGFHIEYESASGEKIIWWF